VEGGMKRDDGKFFVNFSKIQKHFISDELFCGLGGINFNMRILLIFNKLRHPGLNKYNFRTKI